MKPFAPKRRKNEMAEISNHTNTVVQYKGTVTNIRQVLKRKVLQIEFYDFCSIFNMDPIDQYYKVLKKSGLDGPVACEVIDLTKNGKLMVGELNQNAIESLKDLPSSKAIEVLTAFSKKNSNPQADNNQRICDMIRNKKEQGQARQGNSKQSRPNQADDRERQQPVYSAQRSQSINDVNGQGLMPTPGQNTMYGDPLYPPSLLNMPPGSQGVYQQRGPSNYQPRGPSLNQLRGPSLNQPRGQIFNQPRGPNVNQQRGPSLNQPRGQIFNQPRGPNVSQQRGPSYNQPRGPGVNQRFSFYSPSQDWATLGQQVPPNMYQGNIPPNYNQQPSGNLNIISDLPVSGNTEKGKRGKDKNVKPCADERENKKLDKNMDRLLKMSDDSCSYQEVDKETNKKRGGRRGGRGKSRNNETNENSEESDNDVWKGSTDVLNKDSRPMLGNKYFSESNLAGNRGRDRTSNRRTRGGPGRGRGGNNQTVDAPSFKGQDSQGCRGQRQGRGRDRGMGGRKYDDNVIADNSDEQSDSGSCHSSFRGSQENLDRPGKRGRGRGGRARGRGAGGTVSRQRTETSSTISESDTHEDDDDNIDENKVFKFVVKECKGLISLSEFTEKCHLFPEGCDITKWFRRHRRRFRLIVENHEIVYIAPLYMDATICLDHNRLFSNSRGCRKQNCEHFHICKNYVAGFCRFRDKCRYCHNFGSKTNREKKQRLGLDGIFTNADLRIILQNRYPMLCPNYFGEESCGKKNACPFLHLCKKFISGKCAEGSNCKYSHEMKTGHNMWILGLYGWAAAVRKNEDFVKKVILIGRSRKSSNERVEHIEDENEEDEEEEVDDENVDDENVDDENDEEDDENVDDGNMMDTFKEMEEKLPAKPVSRKDRFKGTEETEPRELEDLDKMILLQQNFEELQHQMEELRKSKETSSGTKPKEAWNKTPDKPKPRQANNPSVTRQQEPLTKDDAATMPICAGYVGGTCKSCDKGHHPTEALPYLWQIKVKTWVCLDSMRNQEVEEEFCRNAEVIGTEILVDGTSYLVHICYDEQKSLKAVVYVCDGVMVDNSYSLPARRLSTESYSSRSDKVFYTQWRWYWKDDNGTWMLYDKDLFQKTLEAKYLFGQPSFLFTRSNYQFKYRIDFRTFKQVNLDSRKLREIMRRPLYVSSSDVTNKKFRSLSVPPIPAAPKNFSPWDMTSDFELVELDPGKLEFKDVKSHFRTTMESNRFKITFIYRVQNRKLLSEYKMKKKNMMDDIKQDGDNRDVGEKDLFHGTDAIDTCRAICTNNFDFRTSGKNATMYGEGSYFAVDAKYSHSYTKEGDDGQRYIFRAKILAGLSTKGHSTYRRPPLRDGQAHKLFDSCVDTEDRPNIYVIFDRGQCYPEYLIAYREDYSNAVPQAASSRRQVETNYPASNVAQQETPPVMRPELIHSNPQFTVKKVMENVAAPLIKEQLRSYLKEVVPLKEKRHHSDKECVVQ